MGKYKSLFIIYYFITSQGSSSTMPWIDEDTLKALGNASWQSASIPDDSTNSRSSGIIPDSRTSGNNINIQDRLSGTFPDRSSGTFSDKSSGINLDNENNKQEQHQVTKSLMEAPAVINHTVESPEMAKLDELIQSLSEL